MNGAGVARASEGRSAIDSAEWKVLSASVTGRAHVARDQGNEDAVSWACLNDGTLLLALADGAGSAGRAAEGAGLAVGAAVASLSARLEGSAEADLAEELREALVEVRRAIAGRLRELRGSERATARELASTLLLAVVRGDALAVLQLGDGAAVVKDEGGWRRVTRPLRGHHAGETIFAVSQGAGRLAEIEVLSLEGTLGFALLSDGLEPVATDMGSGEPHDPFFDPLAAFARREAPGGQLEDELCEFLASDRVQSRSSDDLSLILAVRRE